MWVWYGIFDDWKLVRWELDVDIACVSFFRRNLYGQTSVPFVIMNFALLLPCSCSCSCSFPYPLSKFHEILIPIFVFVLISNVTSPLHSPLYQSTTPLRHHSISPIPVISPFPFTASFTTSIYNLHHKPKPKPTPPTNILQLPPNANPTILPPPLTLTDAEVAVAVGVTVLLALTLTLTSVIPGNIDA